MKIFNRIYDNFLTLKPKIIKHKNFKFLCHNTEEVLRAKTALTKEIITTNWISQMNKDSIFIDIGANVGIYSLMAASQGAQVYSFEPHFQNYYSLNMNIRLNNFHEKVKAYCLGVGESRNFETFFHFKFSAGSSTSQMSAAVDDKGNNFIPAFEQGIFSITLDDLHSNIPIATATEVNIKIDVDGLERKILYASQRMLAEPKLKSILVELSEAEFKEISIFLSKFGLLIDSHEPSNKKKISSPINYLFKRQ